MTGTNDDRASRLIFLIVVAVFLTTGLLTSVWISLGQFDDPFCYGRVQLWNALDPGALYFSDAVQFFTASKVECFHHPGLTMDLIAGGVIRVVYLLAAPFHRFEDFNLYVVTHRFFFFGLCSFLSTLCFLACCQPLAALTRRYEISGLPLIVCSLFLCSVPVLLFINRFSDEPYYLLFGLWSLELGLRALDRPRPYLLWFLAGASAALSILAKPLMLPAFVVLALLALVKSGHRLAWLLLEVAGAVVVAIPLLLKLPVRKWLELLVMEAHNRENAVGPLEFLGRYDQAPLVLHHVVLLCAGVAGAIVLLKTGGRRNAALLSIALTLAMFALIARRPDWHYYFGFYWCVLALAGAGTMILMEKVIRSPALRSAGTFVLLVLLLNVWGYWGLLSTYKQYYDRWTRRLPIARRDPNALPAVWEKRVGDTNLSEIFPVRSEALQRALTSLRNGGE